MGQILRNKAEENALYRALRAREQDGRNAEQSYKAQITFSVRDLDVDDNLPGTYIFEWKACVEVSDIPVPVDISTKANCYNMEGSGGWPGERILEHYLHGVIVPLVDSIYLAPEVRAINTCTGIVYRNPRAKVRCW